MTPISPGDDARRGSAAKGTEPRFLVIGQVTRPHGVAGEIRVLPYTDEPERFTWLDQVYVADDPDHHPSPVCYAIESARLHNEVVLLKLSGVDDRQTAEGFRKRWLLVARQDALPLAEGEYYPYQLEGLQVATEDGEPLGKIEKVLETGANRVFLVLGERGELLLPDIPSVVLEIDLRLLKMTVRLLPGLVQ